MKKALSALSAVLFLVFFSTSAFAWTVEKAEGEVNLKVGDILKEGQTIVSGPSGRVLLKEKGSELWIVGDTKIKLEASNEKKKKQLLLDLLQGKIRAKVAPQAKGGVFPYRVRTRSVVAGVRGTEFFVAMDAEEEKICTLEGKVALESLTEKGKKWELPAGKGFFRTAGAQDEIRVTSPEQMEKWRADTFHAFK